MYLILSLLSKSRGTLFISPPTGRPRGRRGPGRTDVPRYGDWEVTSKRRLATFRGYSITTKLANPSVVIDFLERSRSRAKRLGSRREDTLPLMYWNTSTFRIFIMYVSRVPCRKWGVYRYITHGVSTPSYLLPLLRNSVTLKYYGSIAPVRIKGEMVIPLVPNLINGLQYVGQCHLDLNLWSRQTIVSKRWCDS